MIALQADPMLDPAVATLRDELMKTLPTIAGAKAQMEGIVGKSIGPETLLLALFIVFCGRGVMMVLDKAVDEWRATRKDRRDREREDRALGIEPTPKPSPRARQGAAPADPAA